MKRAVKVEVKFDGSTWVDISSKAKLAAGVSITRGRESEVDDPVAVGTVSLALDNSDGRFSPELASSPYYPYVVAGVPVRVSVYVSGAYRVRGYGRVQGWGTEPLSWYVAECAITASDVLGDLPEYTFRQASDEVFRRSAGLLYHWPIRGGAPFDALTGDAQLADNAATFDPGGMLALDEGTDPHPLFKSASGGLTLTVPRGATLPNPWRLRFVLMAQPTADCTLLQLTIPGNASLDRVAWTAANGIGFGGGGGVMPSSWPAVVEVGAHPTLPTNYVLRVSGSAFTDGLGASVPPSVIRVNPNLSGGATWSLGHLALMAGSSDATTFAAFASALLQSRLSTDAVSTMLGFAGGPTIAGVPASQVILPPLEGRDSAEVLGAVVKGMGARLRDNLDGTLSWSAFGPSGTVVTLPAGFSPPRWGTDDRAWLSDCTVSWPDGTSYTATRADGPRRSDTIEAVHATPNGDRGMADWLVNSPTRARVTSVTYNLSAMSDANVLTVLGLTIGSRVSFPTMPAWIPSGLICIVEGFSESIESDAWTLTINLSPDVYSRLFILGDPVQGVLDGTYLLGP